jgi:MFS family permease
MFEDRSAATPYPESHVGPTARIAAVLAMLFAGSTLITPLYPLYQEKFGFSALTLTLVYAAYVVGNLVALLVFGRLSDQIGRRRVAFAAIALGAASTLLFLFARGVAWLYAARALSGLAIGCGAATTTAWITDHMGQAQRPRASVTAAAANFLGITLGALIAGPLIEYAPHPFALPYVVYLTALAVIAAVAAPAPETVAPRRLREVSLRPRVGVPGGLRAQFIAPAVTAFATFALVGFYAALVPGMVFHGLGEHNRAIAAAIVGELFAAAVVVIIATPRLASRRAMQSGLALLIPSVGLLVLAQAQHSLAALIAASGLGGVASALGYRGSLQLVTELAPDDRRAELLSSYYIVGFLGNAMPVIGTGVLTNAIGATAAEAIFGAAIAVFAIGALIIAAIVSRRRRTARTARTA